MLGFAGEVLSRRVHVRQSAATRHGRRRGGCAHFLARPVVLGGPRGREEGVEKVRAVGDLAARKKSPDSAGGHCARAGKILKIEFLIF